MASKRPPPPDRAQAAAPSWNELQRVLGGAPQRPTAPLPLYAGHDAQIVRRCLQGSPFAPVAKIAKELSVPWNRSAV
jgi:hypothetical protein